MPNLTAKEAAEALANRELDKVLKNTPYGDDTVSYHEEVDVESRTITSWNTVAGEKAIMDDRKLNAAQVQVLQLALAEAEGALNKAHWWLRDDDEQCQGDEPDNVQEVLQTIRAALETIAALAATQPKESQNG